MPVRFKGTTEYVRNYDWRDSYKSASFTPTKDQAASTAGNPSGFSEPSFEPAMQRKKRPIPVTTTSTTKFFTEPGSDDYTLLGAQNKFASNVVYKSQPLIQAALASQNNNAKSDKPPKPRPDKSKTFRVPKKDGLKPAPVVDTSSYKPPSPIAPRSPGERRKLLKDTTKISNGHVDALPEPPSHVNAATRKLTNGQADLSDGPKNNNNAGVLESKASSKTGAGLDKPKEAPISSKTQVLSKKAPPPKTEVRMKDAIAGKRSGSMNEYVQTDMPKGVAESAPEAPAEYALKYRAGIPPPRSDKKRKTEYQKEFSWKKPMDATPILSAEQLVYGSHPNLSPSKTDPVPKETEYNRQFQPWHLYAKPLQENVNNSAKNAKLKRSKSEAELVPRSEEDRRLIKDAQNPLKFHMPHGKHRRWKTEYKSNYNPPAKFKYEGGAWKGAAPPHVHSQENLAEQETVPPVSNWYAEVLELRNKADEYRKRSLGTHFSREHVAQLLARQAELWDEVSSNASLSALSLESAPVENVKSKRQEKPVLADKPAPVEKNREDVKRKLAWGDTDSVRSSSTSRTQSSSSQTLVNGDDSDGRIPTPELKPTGETRRHHLDVTTPAVGGALLVSPQPWKKQQQTQQKSDSRSSGRSEPTSYAARQSKTFTKSQQAPQPARLTKPSHVPGGPYYRRYSDESSESSSSPVETSLLRPKPQMSTQRPATQPVNRKSESRVSMTSPTHGMPTRDTHELLDEDAPFDSPLQTRFVASPSKKTGAARDRPNSGSIYGRPMSAIPQKRQLNAIDERMGQTYITPPKQGITREDIEKFSPPDDDSLSTSMQSLASSSSLASETLDRARSRRDEFWGKPGATRR